MGKAVRRLDERYTAQSGRVFLTGLQALVRLPLMQRQRDRAAGLNTAGYISGYRGSPLGGYDAALLGAGHFLKAADVKFQPGVNEELAATAVWGTQQVGLWPAPKHDGVFAIWYGKGPGVDRCGDAFKHGNLAGSAQHGGVLLLAGDDHGCRSSTIPHQSEQALVAAAIPILCPASVQEYLDFGLIGFAMSRFSGCWVGFKATGDIVESGATVTLDPDRLQIRLPSFALPKGGLNIRDPDLPLAQEARLLQFKLPAVQAFARANGLDRVALQAPRKRLGIVTAGKAYLDVRQALEELGLDDAAAARLGIAVYKVGMSWPLEPQGVSAFCREAEQILVVEEKRSLIEAQLKDILFSAPDVTRCIVGKRDEHGAPLVPEHGELSASIVARIITARLGDLADDNGVRERLDRLRQIGAAASSANVVDLARTPFFCSGCPHNTSTKVPDGSWAMAGIGCHALARRQPNRSTRTITHMGGEGANWAGMASFAGIDHIFQNLGDGTYFHSGLLAIRAAVAAKVNITYKILFNDAVAMTGGQQHDGPLDPAMISRQVHAEGVRQIVVVTDEPWKYAAGTQWAPGIEIRHRDELDAVQRELREIVGVTAIIYDQTCAAEKRRRRKRGAFPDPDKRVFINDLVCEGCGDCSTQSNCVSVAPLDTEWGRKRQIDQSNCNKDFSCLKGFCPSFVTVHGAKPRTAEPALVEPQGVDGGDLPPPKLPDITQAYNLLITGVGGTGVVTVSAILGQAAHIDGIAVSVLDQLGLAQKNGAVASHVRIAARDDALHSTRIGLGAADALIACDVVAAVAPEFISTLEKGHSKVIANTHVAPPGSFVLDQSVDLSPEFMLRRLGNAASGDAVFAVNATQFATAAFGNALTANMFLLGFAYQHGVVPISEAALMEAVTLNGVSVDANKRAFALGRRAAHDPAWAQSLLGRQTPAGEAQPETLETLVARRQAFLTDYQDAAYASRYVETVRRVERAEREKAKGRSGLAETVARNLFTLMSYKDEYEVARLHLATSFQARLDAQFAGGFKLTYHLAPPLLARPDPATGVPRKMTFGPWIVSVFRLLARFKGLRGTAFDPFGYTQERRMERGLIDAYGATIDELLTKLTSANHAAAIEIARIPETIRGFGHIKRARVEAAQRREHELLSKWRNAATLDSAA